MRVIVQPLPELAQASSGPRIAVAARQGSQKRFARARRTGWRARGNAKSAIKIEHSKNAPGRKRKQNVSQLNESPEVDACAAEKRILEITIPPRRLAEPGAEPQKQPHAQVQQDHAEEQFFVDSRQSKNLPSPASLRRALGLRLPADVQCGPFAISHAEKTGTAPTKATCAAARAKIRQPCRPTPLAIPATAAATRSAMPVECPR